MDSPILPHLAELKAYQPGVSPEDVARERGIPEAVKLSSNENPLGPSPIAVDAIRKAAAATHRYPDSSGRSLIQAIQAHFEDAAGAAVVLGHGSNSLIDLLCRTFAGPGDHAISGDPTFSCYRTGATVANAAFQSVPLRDHLYPDVEPLLSACRPETKLLFVANPNNPTGTYLPHSELLRLCTHLPPKVILVVDEAYAEYADAQDYRSAMGMLAVRERLVVLRTFSKAFGLASLRVGFAVTSALIAGALQRVQVPFSVGGVGQAAALAALEDRAHLERTVLHNVRERKRMAVAFAELGYQVVPSQANFLLVRVGERSGSLYDELLQRGVIVRALGPPLASYLRVSVGTRAENDRLLSTVATLTTAGP